MNYKEKFNKEIRPTLQKELNIKNIMATPALEKIVINIGIGTYIRNHKDFDDVIKNISIITGQKPVVRKSRMAISNFKLRLNVPVGLKTTLRGKRMYNFMHKLVNVIFPRIRDFRGLSLKSLDGLGNYSIGIQDFTIFPEINLDDVVHNHGLQISIITTAKNNQDGEKLLRTFGFPFK